MPIVLQSKGLQHCKDIKKDALSHWYLFGGTAKTIEECIKIALEDHVKMCQEEAIIMGKENPPLAAVGGEDNPF